MKKLTIALALAVAVLGAVFVLNLVSAGRPVREALASNPRNERFELSGHLGNYVDHGTLVLDLNESDNAAAVDLFRGLFQVAEAFHKRNRRFSRVILSGDGTRVFTMDGADFANLGAEYSRGENPIYLARKLPEKLRRPDGTPAYESSYSGLIGEMNNAADAATKWANIDQ